MWLGSAALTRLGRGAFIAPLGRIIEPLPVLSKELEVTIPNWPPPKRAIRYTLVCRGNDVYRVKRVERLTELPAEDDDGDGPMLLSGTSHLLDACEAIGLETAGAWVGYYLPRAAGCSARVVAWAV